MKNIIILFIIIIVTASCSSKKLGSGKDLVTTDVTIHNQKLASYPSTNEESNAPSFFELNPPVSKILRSSLTIFEEGYERLYSDSGVMDFASNDKIIAILTKNQLVLNIVDCPSIVLDKEFSSVSLFDANLIVYDRLFITLYSLSECAKVTMYNRVLTKSAAIVQDKVIEYEGTRVVVRDALSGDILAAVDTDLNIVSVFEFKGKIALIHSNGYITYFDDKLKTFLLTTAIPIAFREVSAQKDYILGVDIDGGLFAYNNEKLDKLGYYKCKLSHSSLAALCDGNLIYKNTNYGAVEQGTRFVAGSNLYIAYVGDHINIFKLKKTYQKYIIFDYKLPKPCLTPKGNLYYTTLSGKVVGVIDGNEKLFDKMPKVCDTSRAYIRKGKIFCDKKVCADFADIVSTDAYSDLFRRVEDGKVYYFFADK